MAQDGSTANRSKDIYICHICSNCASPVIHCVDLQATAHTSSVLGSPEDKCLELINEFLSNTKNCQKNKAPLGLISGGRNKCLFAVGLYDACPNCRNIEIWQSCEKTDSAFLQYQNIRSQISAVNEKIIKYSEISSKNWSELLPQNYPVLFETFDDAQIWALQNVHRIIETINSLRSDDTMVSSSEKKAVSAEGLYFDCKDKKSAIPEKDEIETIGSQIHDLIIEKNGLSAFELLKAKQINDNISNLQAKDRALRESYNNKVFQIEKTMVCAYKEYNYYAPIAWGTTGRAYEIDFGNKKTYCYIAEPQDP